MQTKPLSIAAAVLAALAISACGEKPAEPKAAAPAAAAQEKPAAAAAPAAAQKCKSAEEIRALVKSKEATPDEYFAVLETFACCPVDKEDLELNIGGTCATTKALEQLSRDNVRLPAMSTMFDRMLTHSVPQVRGEAYRYLGRSDAEAFKKAIETETDLYALNMLIGGLDTNVASKVEAIPETGEFLKKMTTHEHPRLRRHATSNLAQVNPDKVPGALEAVIARLSDENLRVRNAACSSAGLLGVDAVVEPIVAILKDASKANMHGDCIQGLSNSWLHFPFYDKTSAAAYKATLDYFKTTPRSMDVPAGMAVYRVADGPAIPRAGTKEEASNEKFVAWKQKASYYKPDELAAVMLDIVKDPQADRNARTGAVKLIGKVGGLAALKKIASTVEALKDDSAEPIKKEYAKELEEAEKATAAK